MNIVCMHVCLAYTMLSKDRSIMNVVAGQFSVIDIQPGFTEAESLSLFSSYLKVASDFSIYLHI